MTEAVYSFLRNVFGNHPNIFVVCCTTLFAFGGLALSLYIVNKANKEEQSEERLKRIDEGVFGVYLLLGSLMVDPNSGVARTDIQEAASQLAKGYSQAAEEVLQRVAERRVTQGDIQDAADTYKHLGDLASTYNESDKAQDFYTKAAQLLDTSGIDRGIAQAEAEMSREEAARLSRWNSALPIVTLIDDKLVPSLSPIWERLRSEGRKIAVNHRQGELPNLASSVRQGTRTEETLLEVCLGEDSVDDPGRRGPFFFFGITVSVVIEGKDLDEKLPDRMLPAVAFIQRWKTDIVPGHEFPHITKVVTQDEDGQLWIFDEHFREGERTDLPHLFEFISAIVIQKEAWQAARFRS